MSKSNNEWKKECIATEKGGKGGSTTLKEEDNPTRTSR